MAKVKIEAVLSKDTKQAYEEARTRAATLADEHQRAEDAAFMALMRPQASGVLALTALCAAGMEPRRPAS